MGLTRNIDFGIEHRAHISAVLNQVDENLLDDGTFLTTEEGYLIVEQDNIESYIISED